MRILVIEDEIDMNNIITKKLTREGFSVDSCFDGEESYNYIINTEYDVILLDVMIPKIDGFSLMEKIRAENIDTPVIFLTAKDDVESRVKGLDLGANDYLIKPFSFAELMARIRVMTRLKSGVTTNVLTLSDLTLDISSHVVKRDNRIISLSAKEFKILKYMMMNAGIVLTRDKIENHIWNYDFEGGTNVVDVYIRYLRKKIDDGFDVKLIHTIRGSGYVMKEGI